MPFLFQLVTAMKIVWSLAIYTCSPLQFSLMGKKICPTNAKWDLSKDNITDLPLQLDVFANAVYNASSSKGL